MQTRRARSRRRGSGGGDGDGYAGGDETAERLLAGTPNILPLPRIENKQEEALLNSSDFDEERDEYPSTPKKLRRWYQEAHQINSKDRIKERQRLGSFSKLIRVSKRFGHRGLFGHRRYCRCCSWRVCFCALVTCIVFTLALLCTLGVCLYQVPMPSGIGCLDPLPNSVDLWCAHRGGYVCTRIPSLLYLPDHTLLAFAEARKNSCSDEGYIDTVVRKSTDDGASWGESRVVFGNSSGEVQQAIGDACPVYDAATGFVHVVFTNNNFELFVIASSNAGLNWGTPKRITEAKWTEHPGQHIGTGHASGIQLQSGRLVVPAYCMECWRTYVIVSDDHGATWSVGGVLDAGGEAQVQELQGDHLLMNMRSKYGYRLQSHSSDGGRTWTKSEAKHDLQDTVWGTEGSLLRHPNGKLYFSNPSGQLMRESFPYNPFKMLFRHFMQIKVSEDGGRTWKAHQTVWTLAAGYSAMVAMGSSADSKIGLLYSRDNQFRLIFEPRSVTFTTVGP